MKSLESNPFNKCLELITMKGASHAQSCENITEKRVMRNSKVSDSENIETEENLETEEKEEEVNKREDKWNYLEKIVDDSQVLDLHEFMACLSVEQTKKIFGRCGLSWQTLCAQIIRAKKKCHSSNRKSINIHRKTIKALQRGLY